MRRRLSSGFIAEEQWTFDKYRLPNVEDREKGFRGGRVSGETNSQSIIAEA